MAKNHCMKLFFVVFSDNSFDAIQYAVIHNFSVLPGFSRGGGRIWSAPKDHHEGHEPVFSDFGLGDPWFVANIGLSTGQTAFALADGDRRRQFRSLRVVTAPVAAPSWTARKGVEWRATLPSDNVAPEVYSEGYWVSGTIPGLGGALGKNKGSHGPGVSGM